MTTSKISVEYVSITSLRGAEYNPRQIEDINLKLLTESLDRFGIVDPIIARRDGLVIGGHQRLKAAESLGLAEVPVVFLDVDDATAKAMNVALNNPYMQGTWDDGKLAVLLEELRAEDKLEWSGFDDADLKKLLTQLRKAEEGLSDPDAIPETPDDTDVWVQPGELYLLGAHRILCGDSTNAEDVARLMNGEKAVLLATDPPYLVDYVGGQHPRKGLIAGENWKTGKRAANWDEYVDPESSVEFYAGFLRIALEHLQPHSPVYQWHATRRQALVEAAWRQVGLLWHQTIIWKKLRGVLTHSHYLWSHEPCAYGWVEGNQPKRRPPANERTVWEVDQKGENDGIHPTQKPVELFDRPIQYHTQLDEVVYEPFSGSGTQIIAAERLGRRCFAMEKEPKYVQVAIERWQTHTGRKAELA